MVPYRRLSLMEREEFSRMLAAGHSLRATALALSRASSPLSDLALVLWTPHTIRWDLSHEWNSASVYARV